MLNRFKPFYFCLFVGLATILTSGQAQARLGDTFAVTRSDSYFRFFRFDTAAKIIDGEIVTRPWANTFKNRLEVHIKLGTDSVVTGLEILVDSTFLDSAKMWSHNLTGNFIKSETMAIDSDLIRDFANEIEFFHVHNRHYLDQGEAKLPDTPTEAYETYLGKKDTYDMKLNHSLLHLSHFRRGKRLWFSMRLSLIGMAEPQR